MGGGMGGGVGGGRLNLIRFHSRIGNFLFSVFLSTDL